MKKSLLVLFMALFVLLAVPGESASAQGGPSLPPAILTFTSNLSSVTVEALESGAARAVLRWQTVGLARDQFRLQLHVLALGDWAFLADATVAPNGQTEIPVQPSLDFGPPTYRLSIINRQGTIISQQIVVIPFDPGSLALVPSIVSFEARTPLVDFVALANGQARVQVAWRVRDRIPTANLIFEQVLPDGNAVSVELPRQGRWIASTGEGVVAPVLTSNDVTSVQIRLRVVDMRDDRVYNEAILNIGVSRPGSTIVAIPGARPTAIPPLVLTPTPSS